jgi:phage tail P2-like protein
MTSLLPPNATLLERAIEATMARIGDVPVDLRTLWNAQACPLPLLPWLAWALSIDGWDPAWSEEIKRARVAQAITIQRSKGTLASIRAIVGVFGGAISLREWWETTPKGTPHTFDVVLSLSNADGTPPSAKFLQQVIEEISATKPLRSHFTFTQALQFNGAIGMVGAARTAVFARLSTVAPAA